MKRTLLAFLCFAWCLVGAAFGGLEIKETKWGFDEQVVRGRFNLLSVRVAAPGGAFEGELALTERGGAGDAFGAPIVQPLYVTPGTERWVQFSVFISRETDWDLRWGADGKDHLKIDGPQFASPPTVLLYDPSSLLAQKRHIRAFPEDLFPASLAAIDGLAGVVLDHQPRWDAPRREAFLDWLRAGGTVHVLRAGEEFPTFEGDLALLNTDVRMARLGLGTILRHEKAAENFTLEDLEKAGVPKSDPDNAIDTSVLAFDEKTLTGLAGLTRPEISWWLIYLLTLIYLVLIGPVHYYWAKRFDYRLSLIIFGATVSSFALAFIVFGRRGAGEVQISHSLSVARALKGNRYEVMQWISAFATDGDTYRLTHEAPVNVYSASSNTERVNGRITNGRDGFFEVDIPLYSSRPFLHRAVMVGPDLSVKIEKWEAGDEIVLRPGPNFPEEVTQFRGRLWNGLIEFRKKGAVWTWNRRENVPEAPQQLFADNSSNYMNAPFSSPLDFKFGDNVLPLIRRAIDQNAGTQAKIACRKLNRDELELFIFAPQPANFGVKAPGFKREQGWVLYVRSITNTAP